MPQWAGLEDPAIARGPDTDDCDLEQDEIDRLDDLREAQREAHFECMGE